MTMRMKMGATQAMSAPHVLATICRHLTNANPGRAVEFEFASECYFEWKLELLVELLILLVDQLVHRLEGQQIGGTNQERVVRDD
jgi:hypothetical protein